ncbi:MAG TPA: sigma-54 dependent transcriptional regulator [Burkholderiaceae bacterium]|nr:sigma-54 dependent transcriptional regulator [Burkholderiaceae bacterium]
MSPETVFILDDDADVGTAARLLLQRGVGPVRVLRQPSELGPALDAARPAVLLLDMNFSPGRTDGEQGLALLRQTVARADAPAVVVMTAYANVEVAVQALKLGAFDFVTKPWDNARLVAIVQAAVASRRAPVEAAAQGSSLLGDSAPMQGLRRLIASVAPTEANVLILGEMGVGKELVARELHLHSQRAAQAFLPVDLGALPESTFESELFGHRRGSFTDARSDRAGRFQVANGGTLFLDEVGNLPLVQQGKLLTALERREVTPLGADRAEPVDVRVVSATNLDERRLFDPSCFRADLLYRLNTVVLRVPPLRERREDIPLLARHYLEHYANRYAKPARALSPSAARALQEDDWHGNVRALRHACERAVILGSGERLEVADFQLGAPAATPAPRAEATSQRLDEVERSAVAEALRAAQGNLSEAARRLGVSRAALYRRLEKHGL